MHARVFDPVSHTSSITWNIACHLIGANPGDNLIDAADRIKVPTSIVEMTVEILQESM
jgi:hypothetical protein